MPQVSEASRVSPCGSRQPAFPGKVAVQEDDAAEPATKRDRAASFFRVKEE